ncbi:MAG: glycine C-acetyltransferase [Flavobacteriales bacterium]|nr:glycine C-acetyltransferase [Flavobacteriales bacterium]|tara:strand:+ start:18162 stop:19346 length:1185 start_codon:yes stop_codon:yes gene_type:complete
MKHSTEDFFSNIISETKKQNLYKDERVITSSQSSSIQVNNERVINLCANNYLGLSSHPEIINAAKSTLDTHGFGMSSVRFICGTQDIHKKLENTISNYLLKEDTILYAAAFDANGGLFEPLLNHEDAIISDELNHASIIDGIRLCKAQRFRYKNSNMLDLEDKLKDARNSRFKMIVTDGVFSMDGSIAKLDQICTLAKKYNALVMVDDCHATGFIGPTGRGSAEHCNVLDRVDIITGTLGKALGGAMGGFTSASKTIIDILRQKSRPYLFSNSLAPSIVGAGIKAFELLDHSDALRQKLNKNTIYFRSKMVDLGFDILPGVHPIVPIMLYDAKIAQDFSRKLLEKGVYVVGFFFPVVPKKLARIRVQLSASHSIDQLDFALNAFAEVGQELKII